MAYTDLITSQHRGKPKFEAMVALVSGLFLSVGETLASFPEKFDLDDAEGAQLDVIGEWAGISRNISTALANIFFSLDEVGLGLDEGYIKGQYDQTTGITRLDDETYRMVIRAKIGANHWDGSLESLQDILDQVFLKYQTSVFVGDHQDMSMSFYMVGETPPPVIVSLLTGGYLAIKPAGVRINGYFKPSVDGSPFFALDGNGEYAQGFDSGALAIPI